MRLWGASIGLPIEKLPTPTESGADDPPGQKKDAAAGLLSLPPQGNLSCSIYSSKGGLSTQDLQTCYPASPAPCSPFTQRTVDLWLNQRGSMTLRCTARCKHHRTVCQHTQTCPLGKA